jgi:hypothetical protein
MLRCKVSGFIVAAISGLLSCTNELPSSVSAETAALAIEPAALGGGTARPLVDGIAAAENLLFSSTGRLFVSGDDGIFEIVQEAGSYRSLSRHRGETCHFGGLTEVSRTLYAVCYDQSNTRSVLFAAPLDDAPEFRAIHQLPGIQLANGLTTDGEQSLFIAATLDGQLLRLQLSAADPLVIAKQETLVPDAGPFANGLKFHDGTLYWTNFTLLETAQVRPNGSASQPRAFGGALTFMDDLYVDASGALVADALVGSVRSFSPRGFENGSTPPGSFDGPSAVLPAAGRLGLPSAALVVSERNAGRVSVFTP